MTDDTGFGVSSTFGGTIPSPGLDRMAAKGLRYTNLDLDSALLAARATLITGAITVRWASEWCPNHRPTIPVTTTL